MTGDIIRDKTDRLGGDFFSMHGLVDAQHGHSAIIAAVFVFCLSEIRLRIR